MSLFATLTEDGSYALTGAGYTAIVLVMLGLLIAGCFITKADEKAKTGTRQLVFAGMALALGFGALGLETILADSLLSNARSQHVLLKLGFRFTAQDAHFKYYRITREDYLAGKGEKRE